MKSEFSYLLSSGNNPKTAKSDKGGVYLTAILNLEPGDPRVCAWATAGCVKACLHTSGNPVYLKGKLRARAARLKLFFENRPKFMERLRIEIERHIRKAKRLGVKPAIRLNGTSDIQWEVVAPELFADYSGVQWYDYTKAPHRLTADWRARRMPPNYDLTLSYSGANWAKCETALSQGGRVAMVFGGITRTTEMVQFYKGFPVVDGDEDDLTFTRPAGCILGLRAKGKAREDRSGFVIWDF